MDERDVLNMDHPGAVLEGDVFFLLYFLNAGCFGKLHEAGSSALLLDEG